jgi:hypothetical protein
MASALDALVLEGAGQAVGGPLGVHERQGPVAAAGDGGGHLDLVHLVHVHEPVGHLLHRDGPGLDLVEHGVALVPLHQAVDDAVERGREQQRLVRAAHVAQHPLDLGQEAHVGHAVGLVEDHGLQRGEHELLAVDEVDEPAGGGDDQLDPLGRGP